MIEILIRLPSRFKAHRIKRKLICSRTSYLTWRTRSSCCKTRRWTRISSGATSLTRRATFSSAERSSKMAHLSRNWSYPMMSFLYSQAPLVLKKLLKLGLSINWIITCRGMLRSGVLTGGMLKASIKIVENEDDTESE